MYIHVNIWMCVDTHGAHKITYRNWFSPSTRFWGKDSYHWKWQQVSLSPKPSHCAIIATFQGIQSFLLIPSGWLQEGVGDTLYPYLILSIHRRCTCASEKKMPPPSKISSQIMCISLETLVLNEFDHLGFTPENNLSWTIYCREQTHTRLPIAMHVDAYIWL